MAVLSPFFFCCFLVFGGGSCGDGRGVGGIG